MYVEFSWAAIAVIVSIIVHGAFSVWWASKITNQIETLNNALIRIDKELERRDERFTVATDKINELNNRITKLEASVA